MAHARRRESAAQMMDGGINDGAVLGVARSATGRRWIWRQGEARTGLGIAQRLGLPEILGRLLAARGVGIEDAPHFLEPTLRALLPDPSCLRDMDLAAAMPQSTVTISVAPPSQSLAIAAGLGP